MDQNIEKSCVPANLQAFAQKEHSGRQYCSMDANDFLLMLVALVFLCVSYT